MDNRPRSREKHVTGGGAGVHRRGSGLGTGPVGGSSPQQIGGTGAGSGSGQKRSGGPSLLTIIIGLAVLLLGGGGGMSMLGGGQSTTPYESQQQQNSSPLFNYGTPSQTQTSQVSTSTSTVDNTVASGSRAKYTTIKGNGKDTATIMVYMCGTDLESNGGMATNDLQEMLNATVSGNINLIVYTGGCQKWRNTVVSSDTNQIYQISGGKMIRLVDNDGRKAMTDPATLTDFIKYCSKNFPANRNSLIFWDHGGGSISGYGYDEKYKSSGSMTLSGINTALKNAGMKFDFIGFDACLMATMENALMLNDYADYMIASEETEPGVGWYYTNWLTDYSNNTSIETVRLGKRIIDDFVDVCAKTCQGQKTTLSIVDLAELVNTVPDKLSAFSKSTSDMIRSDDYKKVSDARVQTREFAQSNSIDQIDLVHFARNIGTAEARDLANALTGCVKYNRTSSNMSNSYGISIFFPYRKASNVDKASRIYSEIGMDNEYTACIRNFAKLEVSGQSVSGGTMSPLPSLFDMLGGGAVSAPSSSSSLGGDMLAQMLGSFLGGSMNVSGLTSGNNKFLSDADITEDEIASYLEDNLFDSSALVWEKKGRNNVISLTEDQWSLVHSIEMNMFYDDGEGYVDLGLDNLFDFDEDGALIGETDKTWLSINDQPVAYYYLDTVEIGDEYTITGRVPVYLNDERAELILVFDNEHPYGYIAGARSVYTENETETVAKSYEALQIGDTIDFICDFYSYDGTYLDSYLLGERMTYSDNMKISNTKVGDGKVKVLYRFTDIYHQQYWTPVLP